MALEQWEEVAFQVINDNGAIRSGWFPTGEGLVDGGLAVDKVWGNFPIQPNDFRGEGNSALSANDSHAIALTQWNNYPDFSSDANYMITAFKWVEDVIYECTSQNNLKEGDEVVISNLDWYEGPITRTVTYADANRFQFLDEAYYPNLTGLYARADVNLENSGRQLEGKDAAAIWPAMGFCYTNWLGENNLSTVIKELAALGVPEERLTNAEFTGGESWHDWQGGEYDSESGIIFWTYIEPEAEMAVDYQTNKQIYGSAFNNTVVYAYPNPGEEINIDSYTPGDYYIVVFQSENPDLNTAGWLND